MVQNKRGPGSEGAKKRMKGMTEMPAKRRQEESLNAITKRE